MKKICLYVLTGTVFLGALNGSMDTVFAANIIKPSELIEEQENKRKLVKLSVVEQTNQQYTSIRIQNIQVEGAGAETVLTAMNEEGDYEGVILGNQIGSLKLDQTVNDLKTTFVAANMLDQPEWKTDHVEIAFVEDEKLYIASEGIAQLSLTYAGGSISFQVQVEKNNRDRMREYVNGFYQTLLNKTPDITYINTWTNYGVGHQWTREELVQEMLLSEDIQKTASSDEDYLNMLAEAGEAELTEDEEARWLQALAYDSRTLVWTKFTEEHPIDIEEMEIVEQIEIQAGVPGANAATTAIEQVTPSASGLAWPMTVAGTVTSSFGTRICPFHGPEHHNGVDLGAATGTPVLATAAGTVVVSEPNPSCGNYIVIDHGNGYRSTYMHCSALYVSVGQTVAQGQNIAAVGMTGNATGPHLDFRLQVNGTYVNPLDYVAP